VANHQKTWENNKNKATKQAVANFGSTQATTVSQHTSTAPKSPTTTCCTICKLKDTIMDKDHLLVCPKLGHTSNELPKLYWDARRLME
jgi:hypothetical protein